MAALTSYIEYLQKLLEQNHIKYEIFKNFESKDKELSSDHQPEQKKQSQNDVVKRLQTNLEFPLKGELVNRYSRQMLLKEISYEGQLQICQAKIAIIGSGGIGCPLALYLAGAGIGTLGLFDSDVVDVTNLHRQIGHKTCKIGVKKTSSLKETLLNLNPNIAINEHPFITASNLHLLKDYDLVIDGSDNPQCRYIVNDFCMSQHQKLLSGACIGWEAQITCYGANESPCYRCLWGDDQLSLGGCSTLGVVGMLPGIVGMILAIEAIKLILVKQSSLEGYLLTYSAKKCQFKKLKLRKRKSDCSACGQNKLDQSTYDYSRYAQCQNNQNTKNFQNIKSISWEAFLENKNNLSVEQEPLILDVRPSAQYKIVHFTNSINIPYEQLSKLSRDEFELKYPQKDKNANKIPVSCTRGVMSKHAVKYLDELGIQSYSIEGGILKYKALFDSTIPQL